MALRTPGSPEQDENKIGDNYSRGLNSQGQKQSSGIYQRGQDRLDSANLRDLENQKAATNSNSGEKGSVQNQEENASSKSADDYVNNFTGQSPSRKRGGLGRIKGLFTGNKKKGPAAAIITLIVLLLFGGIGFFGLSVAPFAFLANVNLDLNDPLSAVQRRTQNQIEKKIFSTKSGSDKISLGCSAIGAKLSIKCKFKTLSPWLEEKLKSVGIEVVEGGKKIGGRTMPGGYKYTAPDGKVYIYDTPEKFTTAIRGGNPELWRDFRRAMNMNWLSMKGKTFVGKVLAKFGLRQNAKELTGDADERTKQLANGKEATPLGEASFTRIEDADGNESWRDEGGNVYTTEQKNALIEGTSSINENVKPLGQASISMLEKVNVGVNVIGYFDAACTVRNLVGSGTIAAKVSNSAQLAKYAMDILPIVGKLQASGGSTALEITPEDAEAVQRFFNDTDARKTVAGFVASDSDDSASVDEITNPNYGMNAMDSALYKMSASGGVAQTSTTEINYSLGFGVGSLLESSVSKFLNVANFASIIKKIDACDYIQSRVVRTAGLIIGGGMFIASSVGCVVSIGLLCSVTGAQVAKSAGTIIAFTAATAIVSRFLNAALTDTLISDSMDQSPVARGSALWTGMSVLFSTSSQMRGMVPASAEQIVAYQQKQDVARQEYIALQRETSDPLDINNPYSVTGSLAYTLSSYLPNSTASSTLASLSTGISSFVFDGLSSILSPYSANASTLDPERFKQCDDDSYREIGIDADVQCNVRYVMPEESMQWDSLEVARWMEDNGFVKPDTETGYPEGYSPPAPAKLQEGAMNIIKGVTKDFAKGFVEGIYGVNTSYEDKYNKPYEGQGQRPDGGDLKGAKYAKFLDYCVYRALPYGNTYEEGGALGDIESKWIDGSACRSTTDDDINHFRAYVFDITVNDDLDGPVADTINCGPFGSSSGGSVGGKISESEFKQQLTSYGLPEPQAEVDPNLEPMYGSPVKGYEELLQQLKDSPEAAWAAQAMLNGEKKWKAAGGDVKEYLNTAWVWFETGQSGWPDPYQVNCHDTEGSGTAYQFCGSMYQVGGAQLRDHNSQISDIFQKLYGNTDLSDVLNEVYENSSNALKDDWDYHKDRGKLYKYADSRKSATLADLPPQSNFDSEKTQFITTLLAKDPSIAAALNSFAVSDDDLINVGIRGGGYGYIKEPHRQALANMMMALYLFDGQGPTGGDCLSAAGKRLGSGVGISAVWGGEGEKDITYGFKAVPDGGADPSWYDYGRKHGLSGTEHTGTDIPMSPYAPVYSPVEGIVLCEKNGVGEGINEAGCAGSGDFSGTNTYGQKCLDGYDPSRIKGAGTVMIKVTENGRETGDVIRLGHLAESLVKVGDKITPNQQIGYAGCMNGWHTHVEYFTSTPPTSGPATTQSGYWLVDPVVYLGGATNA